MNRSYRIGYRFQRRVVKHLKERGFNCVVQPKSAFPDIVAWKPFIDSSGRALAVKTKIEIENKTSDNILIPYFVSLIECKVNKYLSKIEKQEAKKILEEGRCNAFYVAYRKKRKLKFGEIKIKNQEIIIEHKEKIPGYLG